MPQSATISSSAGKEHLQVEDAPDVIPSTFFVNMQGRQELFRKLKAGETIGRKHRMKSAEECIQPELTANEKKSLTDKLDRVIRWDTLLTHSTLNNTDIITFTYGDRIDIDSVDWNGARTKILENSRNYKSKVCKTMKKVVLAFLDTEPKWADP